MVIYDLKHARALEALEGLGGRVLPTGLRHHEREADRVLCVPWKRHQIVVGSRNPEDRLQDRFLPLRIICQL